MKTNRFIGDVHGKYEGYKKILKLGVPTIQVGDMGVGFRKTQGPRAGEIYDNPPYDRMFEGNHFFIRGNHDNPEECRKHPRCLPDGLIWNGMMFVGGATSIDKQFRIKDYSWWENEECSHKELSDILEEYEKFKPHTMVTHDCPQSIVMVILGDHYKNRLEPEGTRTRQCFEHMMNIHKPKLWVFGHWHTSLDVVIDGTRFVCLNELEWKDLEVGP